MTLVTSRSTRGWKPACLVSLLPERQPIHTSGRSSPRQAWEPPQLSRRLASSKRNRASGQRLQKPNLRPQRVLSSSQKNCGLFFALGVFSIRNLVIQKYDEIYFLLN